MTKIIKPTPQMEPLPWTPKVITGGSTPDNPIWLQNMKPGTMFLCRPKDSRDHNLLEFTLLFKWKKGMKLVITLNDQEVRVPIDPVRFCATHEWYETIYIPEDNENDRDGGLEDDAATEELHKLHGDQE